MVVCFYHIMAERDSARNPCQDTAAFEKEAVDLVDSEKTVRDETSEAKRIHYVTTIPDCVVCMQTCHHPVRLQCGHIFCFLCLKGVAARSHRCALCRAEVPDTYFENPIVVELAARQSSITVGTNKETSHTCPLYKWFYEGRNGWWQYEDRASDQIEEAFSEGKQAIEILIAGFGYIIDIENMVQYRKNYPTRRRRIKRDKYQADKKGVAGLKCGRENQNPENDVSESSEDKQDLAVGQTNAEKPVSEEQMKSLTEKLETTL